MLVTVVIPVKNGGGIFKKCLQSIAGQTYKNIEILVLDSESEDDSRELAASFGARVINVPSGTFNHGLTRNLGVENASGDCILFTVQDASLADEYMLEKMAHHFTDTDVMAVCGHQAVPHDKDKNPLLWFRRYTEPQAQVRYFPARGSFEKLPLSSQVQYSRWDDVIAMYRKEALQLQPFVSTEFAEDCVWANQALKQGWKLVYDPAVVTCHYHHRDYGYAYNVAFAVNYHFLYFFGYKPPIPFSLKKILQVPYILFRNPELSLREKLFWIYSNYMEILGNFISHVDFRLHCLFMSIAGVEKRYRKICKAVPMGKQKNS